MSFYFTFLPRTCKKDIMKNFISVTLGFAALFIFTNQNEMPRALAQTPNTFEVASIRPLGEASAEVLARFGGGCDGNAPRVARRRFTSTTTLYALTTWAYGFNKNGGCSFVAYGNFLTGGPSWVKTERFEVQALMPEGSTEYTFGQFMEGQAPQLEIMLKNLLADRFRLAVHRETKEVQGYILVVGKDGPKIRPAQNEPQARGAQPARRGAPTPGVQRINMRTTMTYVALMLGVMTRRPVLDRTGLTGEFDLALEFAPLDAVAGDSSAPSLFTAVQEQLGLRLESARVPAEVIVIDRAERPSEN
jgi:uncharacterized protein (TIGR03435 family)